MRFKKKKVSQMSLLKPYLDYLLKSTLQIQQQTPANYKKNQKKIRANAPLTVRSKTVGDDAATERVGTLHLTPLPPSLTPPTPHSRETSKREGSFTLRNPPTHSINPRLLLANGFCCWWLQRCVILAGSQTPS